MDLFRWHLVSTMKISLTMLTLDSFLKFKFLLDEFTEKTCRCNPSDLFSITKKLLCNFFLTACNLTKKFHVFLKFKFVLDDFTGKTCRYNRSDLFSMTKKLLRNYFNRLQFDEKISCLSEIQIFTRWFHGKNLSIQSERPF